MRWSFFILGIVAVCVSSCSRSPENGGFFGARVDAEAVADSRGAPEAVIAESPERIEAAAIKAEARSLYTAKKFKELDDLAKRLRQAEESHPTGGLKILHVYEGVEVDEEAPDSEWEKHLATLREWVKAQPESITPRIAVADALVSYGWKARGSGYADTVTEEGWKLLRERLNQAVLVLRGARALKETCPLWWGISLQAALGLGWELPQYNRIFDEGTTIRPDYAPLYMHKMTYLLPRWHGEEGDWEAFLTRSADALGGEEGDLLYARVIWAVHGRRYYSNVFKECKVNWARCDRGFQVMIERYPNSLQAKSERAYLASLAADPATTLKMFEALEGKLDLSVWISRENFEKRLAWASQKWKG